MTEKIKAIKELIGKARLQKAIEKLQELNTEYNDDVIAAETKLAKLNKDKRMGTIRDSEEEYQTNVIVRILLEVASSIEKEAKLQTEEEEEEIEDEIEEMADIKNKVNVSGGSTLEKVIKRDNLRSINWLSKGIKAAKSVCKVHAKNGVLGTGFLVEGGYLFTNNHVIGSASMAQYAQVEFGYDSLEGTSVYYNLDHKDFFTSKKLDYTRVKIKEDSHSTPLSDWGTLPIVPSLPKQHEALTIIQHPDGRPKEFDVSDGKNSTWDYRLHYEVTTEPGSSGSPVFDINWNVIALHHAGGMIQVDAEKTRKYVNEGILFEYILKDLEAQQEGQQEVVVTKEEVKVSGPVKTILVYHNDDESYAKELKKQLFSLIRQQKIKLFDIQKHRDGGDVTNQLLENELKAAQLVLTLISGNLYLDETLDIAIKVEEEVGNKRVVPIKVAPFDLNGTSFQRLQGLPLGTKSLSEYSNLDKVLYEVSKSIMNLVDKMRA